MLLSSEDDEVRTWADDLIDDEFTAVSSHQTIRLDTNDSKMTTKGLTTIKLKSQFK